MTTKFQELITRDDVEKQDEINEMDDEDEDKVDTAQPAIPALPLHLRHPLEFSVILFGATALAFNAGFINGLTYQFRNIPVSHVTGTTTHAGLNIGNSEWDSFGINLAIIVSFIFGSGITGFYMPESSFQLGREYGPLFIIGSALFLIACLTSYIWPETDFYFYFAAMGSGLQNAMTTKYSGNIIRTTHMTGTATDIGLVLGRVIRGDQKEIWKLKILCPLFGAFLVGGVMSVYGYRHFGRLAMLINVVVFFGIGLAYSFIVGQQFHIPIWKAFFGLYTNIEKGIRHIVKSVRTANNPLHQQSS